MYLHKNHISKINCIFSGRYSQIFSGAGQDTRAKTGHEQPVDNRAVRYKLNHVPSRFLYRSEFVTSWRLLYRPDVCNRTMPYIPRTVPAYAVVRDPA